MLGDHPNSYSAITVELNALSESIETSVTDLFGEAVNVTNKISTSAAVVIAEKVSGGGGIW